MVTCKKLSFFLILFSLAFSIYAQSVEKRNPVKVGADVLLSNNLNLIQNKKIGIITNHSAILSNGVHLVDSLYSLPNVKIISLFGPEHGIRGDAPAGITLKDGIDYKTHLPVFSLYGNIKKPTTELLKNIDILIFDIQDVGARFYTFISTMYYAIQSAAENNIPILILDRPNPINGIDVQGPVLHLEYRSFVGIAELPIRHGMTNGELANFFNRPEILNTSTTANLKVIKMLNWDREYFFDDCGLNWIKTSPNIPNLETAIVYPGMCLLEGTNISEGRGTYSPFLTIGAPFINSNELIKEIELLDLEGISLSSIEFTPIEISNMAASPKYLNEICFGIRISILDRNKIDPIKFAMKLIYSLNKLYPENFSFRQKGIERLWGSDKLRKFILEDKSPLEIFDSYKNELNNFIEIRKNYLLY